MILIVDDLPENIFALETTLKYHNFQVDTALSGEEALKKVLRNTYSLIILDVQMPGMDGFEVAEIIRGHSKSKHTPIIFLSAISKEKKFIEKGYETGGIDYITKPVDPDILLLRVKSLYTFSQQQQELARIKNNLLKEISEKQIYQDQLASKIQELNNTLEALPLIAFTLDATGNLEFVNHSWLDKIRSNTNFPSMISNHEDWLKNWRDALSKNLPFDQDIILKSDEHPDGEHHHLKIVPVVHNNDTTKWIGTIANIHVQKMANDTLEKMVVQRTEALTKRNLELKQINEELQQFTWVMSHDLKEPVRKIQTFANFIRDRFEGLDSRSKFEIERIISSAKRMSILIDDLMGYTKLSIEPIFETTDITEIVRQIISDYELAIIEKQAKIIYDDLGVIEAVPSQIRQVLQNLISNALKFSKPNENPIINIESEWVEGCNNDALFSEQGDCLKITVKDNGIGFDEIYMDKIFQVFQRLENGESFEGTGIGLAIAKKSVEKHHGVIYAKSQLGVGSEFVIILPRKQDRK